MIDIVDVLSSYKRRMVVTKSMGLYIVYAKVRAK
jgi:hypothetical protein